MCLNGKCANVEKSPCESSEVLRNYEDQNECCFYLEMCDPDYEQGYWNEERGWCECKKKSGGKDEK